MPIQLISLCVISQDTRSYSWMILCKGMLVSYKQAWLSHRCPNELSLDTVAARIQVAIGWLVGVQCMEDSAETGFSTRQTATGSGQRNSLHWTGAQARSPAAESSPILRRHSSRPVGRNRHTAMGQAGLRPIRKRSEIRQFALLKAIHAAGAWPPGWRQLPVWGSGFPIHNQTCCHQLLPQLRRHQPVFVAAVDYLALIRK